MVFGACGPSPTLVAHPCQGRHVYCAVSWGIYRVGIVVPVLGDSMTVQHGLPRVWSVCGCVWGEGECVCV